MTFTGLFQGGFLLDFCICSMSVAATAGCASECILGAFVSRDRGRRNQKLGARAVPWRAGLLDSRSSGEGSWYCSRCQRSVLSPLGRRVTTLPLRIGTTGDGDRGSAPSCELVFPVPARTGCKGVTGTRDGCSRSCCRSRCPLSGGPQEDPVSVLRHEPGRHWESAGHDAIPCTAPRGSHGQRGPAVMPHRIVPRRSRSPPQGSQRAREPAAELPDGSGSSCTSGTAWPREKEHLAWSVFTYFFLPELKEILAGITKKSKCLCLPEHSPPATSLCDR